MPGSLAGVPETMRIAFVTTFFPNAAEPHRAIFIRNLAVAVSSRADLAVVSPVPWAPRFPQRPRWTRLRSVPRERLDIFGPVLHPRFLPIPGVGAANGISYGLGILGALSRVKMRGVDLLHVHCAFPDAAGVAIAAGALGLPYVMTAHGSDINVYSKALAIRPQIRFAMRRARAVIGVSRPIVAEIRRLLPNPHTPVLQVPCAGVNRDVFSPRDPHEARAALGVSQEGRLIVFAGQLVPIKGLGTLVEAWARLRDRGRLASRDRLAIVGEGPLRADLEQKARAAHVSESVTFVGEIEQRALSDWLAAATVFCLPSRNEGTPNVIVEALASGRPVVASAVGGIPDLIAEGVNGFLTPALDPEKLADSLERALAADWSSTRIAATAAEYGWDRIAERNVRVYEQALNARSGEAACPQ